MNKTKKIISIFLMIILSLFIFGTSVNAENSGSCGENVVWSFEYSTKTLTISGSGAMINLNTPSTWGRNSDDIVNIVIENGVTTIGKNSFSICENVINIFIPKSVEIINDNAFSGCSKLKNVFFEGNEEDWENITCSDGNGILLSAKIMYNKAEIHECEFGDWIITLEPNCSNNGSKYRECSCGIQEIEDIPKTNDHKYVWKITKEASCTDDGQEESFCSICNKKGETKIIKKFGHQFGDWNIVTEATCANEGLRVKKCSYCGITLDEEKIEKLDHNFGEWKVVEKPTSEKEGIEVRKCKDCKTEETRILDKIPTENNNICGDANGDGKVTATDARLVLQAVAGIINNEDIIFSNADTNNDKKLTASDARIILQIVAGLL